MYVSSGSAENRHLQAAMASFGSGSYRHCKPGGLIIIWTYSAEGNELVRFLVEPMRKMILRHLPRKFVVALSYVVTAALYPIASRTRQPSADAYA